MILLDPLPFPEGGLSPLISEETVHIHYNMHHAGYIKKLNSLIRGTIFSNETNLETIVRNSYNPNYCTDIYNQAAQAYNHGLYWNSMTPMAKSVVSELLDLFITKDRGSINTFKQEFIDTVNRSFGSGWVWMVYEIGSGHLNWLFTSNAETPFSEKQKILAVCDIFEHAYYLDYKNKREEYLNGWWQLINWGFVEKNLFGEPVQLKGE